MQACPVCKRHSREVVNVLEDFPLFEGVVFGSAYDEKTNTQKISICLDCGHIYNANQPPVDFLERAYFQYYSSPLISKDNILNPLLQGNINKIADYLQGHPEIRTIYHGMCNRGKLLEFFDKQGFSVLGHEYDERLLKVARARGLNVFYGNIYDQEDVKADLFYSTGVFEHVSNPIHYLKQISLIVGEGGHVCLNFPNFNVRTERFGAFQFINPHVSYFTEDLVNRLFDCLGFEIKQKYVDSNALMTLFVQLQDKAKLERAQDGIDRNLADVTAQRELLMEYCRKSGLFLEKLERVFDDCFDASSKIAFFGAGGVLSEILVRFPKIKTYSHMIVDNADHKQGYTLPMSQVKITKPDQLLSYQPDYIVLTSSSFQGEIISELEGMTRKNLIKSKVIVLYPEPHILSSTFKS